MKVIHGNILTFFAVWQNRFLYFRVVIGNSGPSRFFIISLVFSIEEIQLLTFTRNINKLEFGPICSIFSQA